MKRILPLFLLDLSLGFLRVLARLSPSCKHTAMRRAPRFLALVFLAQPAWLACSSADTTTAGSSDAGARVALTDGATSAADGAVGIDSGTVGADTGAESTDAGTDSKVGPMIGPGPYSIAFAGTNFGNGYEPTATATFAANGALDGFVANSQVSPTRGTTQEGDLYVDEFSQLGRWNSGNTAGTFYGLGSVALSGKQGFHHALVVHPTAVTATGTVSYSFLAGTSVTSQDGLRAVGSVTGRAAIVFGSPMKLGLELTITMPDDATYTASTEGGVGDPSRSSMTNVGNELGGNLAITDVVPRYSIIGSCNEPSLCRASVVAVVGGGASGSARIALAFVLGRDGSPKELHGAALFKAP